MFFVYMFVIRHMNLETLFFNFLIFSSILIFVVIYAPKYVKFLVTLYCGKFLVKSSSLFFSVFSFLFVIFCVSVLLLMINLYSLVFVKMSLSNSFTAKMFLRIIKSSAYKRYSTYFFISFITSSSIS